MQRQTLSLDGPWDFHFSGDTAVPLDSIATWRSAVVPNPWQASFADLRDRQGRAWYRREVALPEGWAGEPLVLRFGAVNYLARVYVNGTLAVEHEGGWLPFEAEVGGLVKPGTNEIAVEVVAPADDPAAYPEHPFAEIPFGKQSWYGPLGGIWQSVTLERRPADHLRGLRLHPSLADGTVRIEAALSRALPVAGELAVDVASPAGGTIARVFVPVEAGALQAVATLTVPAPLPWSPDTPHLYRAAATLLVDGTPCDRREESFGFRSVSVRDGRIHLNGEPIFLRAALDQDYYPDGICTVPSEAFLEDQFRKAKALGLNCLRCHIKVPDPRYYAVADRVGLLIWTELPNVARLSERAKARLEATLAGILERDGNHPSIVCWTIINENWGTDLVHDAGQREWLSRTYRWLKAADPTRLVVDNSPLWPSYHVESDLEDYHFYANIPDHRGAWDGFVDRLASRREATYSPHGDAVRSGREPVLCSEFGNWGLPHPAALADAEGREPWWFETGHDWGDGVMYGHGIESRFRAAGLDRVFGSLDAFVEAAQWLQFRALKYQIEAMRRRPELAGYVITEFTDCHWECNGLLDMRRNPRAFHNVFPTVNADTVVVPEWRRVAYWAGEPVEVGLAAAHGRGDTVPAVELRWSLDAAGQGGAERIDLAPGVVPGRPAVFTAPEVASPEIHRLEFEVATDSGVLATNHLDLVVHPRREAPPRPVTVWAEGTELRDRLAALGYTVTEEARDAAVLVATVLDPALVTAIREGARLVLLADRPGELQPVFPHFQSVRVLPRQGSPWLGAWASSFSWLRRSGPFAGLPGGPLIDHAFDRVIPDHVIAGCTPWDFQARVHAGLVVGWVHKPVALLLEKDYGHGRLVATTFRLLRDAPGADPTATALLDGLIALALGQDRVATPEPAEVAG